MRYIFNLFELWFDIYIYIYMILDNLTMFWLWYPANGRYSLVLKLVLSGASRACWYRILFALDLRARPWKIQKYYFLHMRLQKHLEWCGTTRSGIGAPQVPLLAKMTKMPLVNPRFNQRSKKVKTLTKQHIP